MTLRPYKFVVQAVVQEVDDEDNVTGEVIAEPAIIYGVSSLEQWARDFPEKLASAKEQPRG